MDNFPEYNTTLALQMPAKKSEIIMDELNPLEKLGEMSETSQFLRSSEKENDTTTEMQSKCVNKLFDATLEPVTSTLNQDNYPLERYENKEHIENYEDFNVENNLPDVDEPSKMLTSMEKQKRRNESETDEDSPELKRASNSLLEEKKIANLRKNIRDVMDETQLDTNTIAAQREESERLARVAEQQKIIREYQRQTAVNRQFVRTQNRVLSLLQNGKTFPKKCDLSEKAVVISEPLDNKTPKVEDSNCSVVDDSILSYEPQTTTESTIDSEKKEAGDIVTIEDSSSEDDCILLSDDEEDLEEETEEEDPSNSGLHVKDAYNIPDELGRVIVNVGHPEGEDDIFIAPQIAKKIKPHQIGGVRFLFDNIIESTKRFMSSSGFGCILSHSMGLGKTLQVVCFCDIFLRHTPSKTILCVMPINTLQNWVTEFNMWTPKETTNSEEVRPRQFDVFILNDQQKTLSARAKVILKWAEEGGVLLIGYELFRLLALKLMPTRKRRGKNFNSDNVSDANKRMMDSIHQALVKPGPDLVICDEGHRIKNAHAGISLALKQIRTRRRIVLTGYPLQNNLLEYWCMVDFVRPNYLGNRTEFCNMFERPIQNGQCIDSTPEDIKLMRYRAHVLHSLLVGFVQRRSHVVLQQTLPQKLEYVVLTRMTAFQRQLYETFMNDVVRSRTVPNPLKAFAVCCKIWNHPDILYNFLKERESDLDIEMDDPDISGELPNSSTVNEANATPCNNKSDKTITENKIPIEKGNISQLENTEKIAFSENNTNCLTKETLSNFTENANLRLAENNTFQKSYDNNYYYPQCNEGVYTPCNGYWQESNAPFAYQNVPNNIGYSSKPNYVGMVAKECTDVQNVTSCSEIVDMDTKEIKTVKTEIDMSRNPIIQKESKPDESSVSLQDTNAQTLSETLSLSSSQDQKLLNDNEKEHEKPKGDDGILHDWAIELMKHYEHGILFNSPKLEVFFCILNESVKMGDRVLLFSQSLLTLNIIEKFLQCTTMPGIDVCWAKNVSYFRLDGSTTSQEREKLVNEFNSNTKLKLFLISTRAGSLGINLVGANRVIVFDASWNPCHDTQAVYRIYRYGQKKPCYVYRIVMDKCLEKKIYDRQIKKQGMSDRVVDECNPDAHLSLKDVTNLCHDYDDDEDKAKNSEPFSTPLESFLDSIAQKLILNKKHCLSKEPFYHESLLIDRKDQKLSQAEKRQAHRGYEMEKKASIKQNFNYSNSKIQYRIVRSDGTVVTRPVASIRPMQANKTNNVVKSGGLRSTRWIPAEVWQRQGMTAQEMTLPLDVVIPTNSSDKSNIILKAGQRVMVLKSVKGIYMQLESGKIIAIRTSSKTNEVNKTNKATDKGEVIDITSEGDNPTDTKTDSNSAQIIESIEKTGTTENTKLTKECVDSKNLHTSKEIVQQTSISQPIKSAKYLPNDKRSQIIKTNTDTSVKKTHPTYAQYPKNDKNLEKTLVRPFLEKNDAPFKIPNTFEANEPSTILKSSIDESYKEKETQIFSQQQDLAYNSALAQNRPFVKRNDKGIATASGKSYLHEEIQPSQLNKMTRMPREQDASLTRFIRPMNSYGSGENLPAEAVEMPKYPANVHQKEYNDFKPAAPRANVTEMPTQQQLNSNDMDYSQQTLLQQQSHQQQHSKLHLYMPHLHTHHSQLNNPTSNVHMSMARKMNPESNWPSHAYLPVHEPHNYSHYDSNVPCNYPSQFPDYSPYGSYSPHFASHFHKNTFSGANPPPAMNSNPYHLHWPSLVASTNMNDPCNTMYTSTAENQTQSNQWHNQ